MVCCFGYALQLLIYLLSSLGFAIACLSSCLLFGTSLSSPQLLLPRCLLKLPLTCYFFLVLLWTPLSISLSVVLQIYFFAFFPPVHVFLALVSSSDKSDKTLRFKKNIIAGIWFVNEGGRYLFGCLESSFQATWPPPLPPKKAQIKMSHLSPKTTLQICPWVFELVSFSFWSTFFWGGGASREHKTLEDTIKIVVWWFWETQFWRDTSEKCCVSGLAAAELADRPRFGNQPVGLRSNSAFWSWGFQRSIIDQRCKIVSPLCLS